MRLRATVALPLSVPHPQKKLLIALAHERTREFDDAYRTRYRLGAPSTVNSAKKKLMEDGYIEQSDGKYCVADPFLHGIFQAEKA